MGSVTYYPAQKLTVNGSEINFAQSADVDFNVNRQLVYEFGNLFSVDNVQVEPAGVSLNFSYALEEGGGAAGTLGLNDFTSLLSDVNGKSYTLLGAGSLLITNGFISSYSVEGSVGNIVIASVSVQALNATYNAGTPSFPAGSEDVDAKIIRPDQITVDINGELPCTSFSFKLDIPREYVNLLGQLESEAIIVSGPPKATMEAEVVLRGGTDVLFDVNDIVDASVNCGGITYSINGAKISSFTSNSKLDGVQTASVTVEAGLKANNVSIGG